MDFTGSPFKSSWVVCWEMLGFISICWGVLRTTDYDKIWQGIGLGKPFRIMRWIGVFFMALGHHGIATRNVAMEVQPVIGQGLEMCFKHQSKYRNCYLPQFFGGQHDKTLHPVVKRVVRRSGCIMLYPTCSDWKNGVPSGTPLSFQVILDAMITTGVMAARGQ